MVKVKVDEYVFEVSDKVNGKWDFLCSIVKKTGFKEEEEIWLRESGFHGVWGAFS